MNNLTSKVRRAFKKAVAVQEITKAGANHFLKAVASAKELRELRQKRASISSTVEPILSKADTSKELMTMTSIVEKLNGGHKIKIPKLTTLSENKQTEDQKKLGNLILERREKNFKSPNFKENKVN